LYKSKNVLGKEAKRNRGVNESLVLWDKASMVTTLLALENKCGRENLWVPLGSIKRRRQNVENTCNHHYF